MGPLGMLLTPWVRRIMVTTVALSILSAILVMWMDSQMPLHLGLEPRAVWGGGALAPLPAVWQLFTYPFIQMNVFGLLLAVLMYGWFGGTLEAWWGSPRFFKFFFGVTGGVALVTVFLAFFWPTLAAQRFLGPYPVIAAMIVAWGLSFPDREIRLFFVLPVKGIHMVWISVGITALSIIFSGAIAPFVPHLVGMAWSALLVTGAWRGKRLQLHLQKWRVQSQIKREQEARRRRKSRAAHLRVVEPDEVPSSGDDDASPRDDGGGGGKKNGADNDGAGGGWLH